MTAKHDRSGSALLLVLLLVSTLGVITGGLLIASEALERMRFARGAASEAEAVAEEAIERMTERLRGQVQLRMGALVESDLHALNVWAETLTGSTSASLDPSETGFRLVGSRPSPHPLPGDLRILDLWSDHPRSAYTSVPVPAGVPAGITLEVEMRARALGPRGVRRTLTRAVAISRIPAHPYALYHAGPAEICASRSPVNVIAGAVRVDGRAELSDCGATLFYGETLEARDGIDSRRPERHLLLTSAAPIPIGSWTREEVTRRPDRILRHGAGRVRIPPAWGGPLELHRFQDEHIAGSGECADAEGACRGAGHFAAGITVRYDGAELQIVCGAAQYADPTDCIPGTRAALDYRAWTAGAVSPGSAAADLARPGRLWRGHFADGLREPRCTARVGSETFRTHRCPTNPYGPILDLSVLPRVTGGILRIRRADPPDGAIAAGAQEMLVIRNGAALHAPLTILSEIPVAIVGSLNTLSSPVWRGSPPMMLEAPALLLLPTEADHQAGIVRGAPGWTSVWDSVGYLRSPLRAGAVRMPPSALPLTAESDVRVNAVIRTATCSAREGVHFGGPWEGGIRLLGDWSRVSVRVRGALEIREASWLSPSGCRASHGVLPGASGLPTADGTPQPGPASRTLEHDPRLFDPAFQPPGSWMAANLPAGGVGSRTRVRQSRAWGGSVAVRVTRSTGSRPARGSIPFPALPAIP